MRPAPLTMLYGYRFPHIETIGNSVRARTLFGMGSGQCHLSGLRSRANQQWSTSLRGKTATRGGEDDFRRGRHGHVSQSCVERNRDRPQPRNAVQVEALAATPNDDNGLTSVVREGERFSLGETNVGPICGTHFHRPVETS
jgi:hypothetical protein